MAGFRMTAVASAVQALIYQLTLERVQREGAAAAESGSPV